MTLKETTKMRTMAEHDILTPSLEVVLRTSPDCGLMEMHFVSSTSVVLTLFLKNLKKEMHHHRKCKCNTRYERYQFYLIFGGFGTN